eukprot:jgi/Chrzof1/6684/Cz19g05190.t1
MALALHAGRDVAVLQLTNKQHCTAGRGSSLISSIALNLMMESTIVYIWKVQLPQRMTKSTKHYCMTSS